MMYCFPYLQFSNSFISPQLKTNKIQGVYLTSSLCGGCVYDVTVPHAAPL